MEAEWPLAAARVQAPQSVTSERGGNRGQTKRSPVSRQEKLETPRLPQVRPQVSSKARKKKNF